MSWNDTDAVAILRACDELVEEEMSSGDEKARQAFADAWHQAMESGAGRWLAAPHAADLTG